MARTKIVQVAPDVSLEVEESPLDSLNRIISTGTAIANLANTLESRSLKKEKDALGVGSLANQLIASATSVGEINNAISLLDDVDTSDFSATTQSTFEVVKKDAESKFNQINEVKSLGNQIAEFVTQPLIDGKTFTQLTANEITDYYYNNKESYDDGALSVIKDNLSNIKRFQALTGSLSGDNKKMLNMTFTGSGGKILKASEFLVGVEDYLKAKDIYLRAGIYDGELDPEEALFVELGDDKGYDNKRKELDATFKELKNDYDAKIKSYDNLIGQVRKKMIGTDNTFSFANMSEAEFINTLGDDNAKDKFIDAFSLQNPELIINPDDRDGALKIIYQYNKNSPGDANAFINELNDEKSTAIRERRIVANKAKKWGFRYFDALDVADIDLSNANKDGDVIGGETEENPEVAKSLLGPTETSEISTGDEDVDVVGGETEEPDGVNYIPATVGAVTATGAGIYYADNIKDAAKYIKSVTNLDGKTITNLLEDSKGIKSKTYKQIEVYDKNINNFVEEIDELKAQRDKAKLPKNKQAINSRIKAKTKNLNNLRRTRINFIDRQATVLQKLYGGNAEDIKKLFGFGKTNKVGNLFKIKSDLISKKLPYTKKFIKGKYVPFRIGMEVSNALGVDSTTGQVIGGGVGVAATEGAKKIIKNPKVKNKTLKFIANTLSQKAATRLATAGAGFLGSPVVGTVTSLLSAGLFAKDIYDIADYLLSEDEITEQENEELKEAADELDKSE